MAGSERYFTIGPTDQGFNWAQAEAVNKGQIFLYLYGFVKFTDDFSFFGSKIIGFCGRYEIDQIGKFPVPITECQNNAYSYSR